jgi:hypothetical protein
LEEEGTGNDAGVTIIIICLTIINVSIDEPAGIS